MSPSLIPVMQPKLPLPAEVAPYLERMTASGTYSNHGPLVQSFESRLAALLNVHPNHVVVTSNATAAIAACAASFDLTDWLVPDYTFSATALGLCMAGKNIHLRDVEIASARLSLAEISRSMGVAYVIPFGDSFSVEQIPQGQPCIVDAAASFGGVPKNLSALPDHVFVVVSLHATKVLGIGEGGFVICGSTESADFVRAWINFGFAGVRSSAYKGINGKMSEIQAAYGLAALDNWPREAAEWSVANHSAYAKSRAIGLHPWDSLGATPTPYWLVRLESREQCDKVVKTLADSGIETRKWWTSLHKMPAFRECSQFTSLRASQLLASTIIGLPMWRNISEEVLERIVGVLQDYK